MRQQKILPIVLLALLSFECAHAQRSMKTIKRSHYQTPKMRAGKAKIICPVFSNSRYPFHALGLKFGDPFALTYKYYANKRLSFAVDFGKAASGLYNPYFRDAFDAYVMQDTFSLAESTLTYFTHRVKSDFVGEAKVLYQFDASGISDGLQFYAGAGWEWRSTYLIYDYSYSGPLENGDPFGSFSRNRVAMGPQLIAGVEYSYFTIPITAFMEVEYFTDIQTDPGWTRLEGGVGLRYVFN